MKGVFILHEGIPSSIFDSQVVGHILHMKNIGIDIDILSFNTEIKILNNSIENKKKLNKIFPAIKIHLINSINIFFDKKTLNLMGWQTVDLYQNLNIVFLSSMTFNQKIKKKTFVLPQSD